MDIKNNKIVVVGKNQSAVFGVSNILRENSSFEVISYELASANNGYGIEVAEDKSNIISNISKVHPCMTIFCNANGFEPIFEEYKRVMFRSPLVVLSADDYFLNSIKKKYTPFVMNLDKGFNEKSLNKIVTEALTDYFIPKISLVGLPNSEDYGVGLVIEDFIREMYNDDVVLSKVTVSMKNNTKKILSENCFKIVPKIIGQNSDLTIFYNLLGFEDSAKYYLKSTEKPLLLLSGKDDISYNVFESEAVSIMKKPFCPMYFTQVVNGLLQRNRQNNIYKEQMISNIYERG